MPLPRRKDPRKDPTIVEHLEALHEAIDEHATVLANHTVYGMVQDRDALRIFMKSHVFAVWDFMTLLKSLQRSLTCIDLPWVPVADTDSARLINEIVVGEETDEIFPGTYWSHYELYLAAMDEVGADTGPMLAFEKGLRETRKKPATLMRDLELPQETRDFVDYTLSAAQLEVHEVAAVFLFGREDVIPAMFMKILNFHGSLVSTSRSSLLLRSLAIKAAKALERRVRPENVKLPDGPPDDAFRVYLERHIELDGESHGPMGEKLLMNLCGTDAKKWAEATQAAIDALKVRRKLWDGVMAEIQAHRSQRHIERERIKQLAEAAR
jgi:hypothetical protein